MAFCICLYLHAHFSEFLIFKWFGKLFLRVLWQVRWAATAVGGLSISHAPCQRLDNFRCYAKGRCSNDWGCLSVLSKDGWMWRNSLLDADQQCGDPFIGRSKAPRCWRRPQTTESDVWNGRQRKHYARMDIWATLWIWYWDKLFRRKAVSTTPNLMFHFVPTQIVNVFSGWLLS